MTTGSREEKHQNHTIVFKSESMRNVFKVVRKVATAAAPVLILGETGVGKELVARAIHKNSGRNHKLFKAINCSALNENLIESELFGHEKDAFTGAKRMRQGVFEQAMGGTLFLDEIGDASWSFQSNLLRVLQEKEFTRVGGNVILRSDARILAATNRNLINEVKSGRFREDLFYRLNVVLIVVPPLCERPEDIKPLTEHFIEKYAKENKKDIPEISDCFWEILFRYDFPGNVRELENLIQRAVIIGESNVLEAGDLSMDLVCRNKTGLIADPDILVKGETLFEALKQITIFTQKGQKKLWHKSLRCISIHDIHRFLMERGNRWFSRERFEQFLRTCSKSDLCKYKTAGHFLSILKANRILKHNGRKANASEYCLDDFYLRIR